MKGVKDIHTSQVCPLSFFLSFFLSYQGHMYDDMKRTVCLIEDYLLIFMLFLHLVNALAVEVGEEERGTPCPSPQVENEHPHIIKPAIFCAR